MWRGSRGSRGRHGTCSVAALIYLHGGAPGEGGRGALGEGDGTYRWSGCGEVGGISYRVRGGGFRLRSSVYSAPTGPNQTKPACCRYSWGRKEATWALIGLFLRPRFHPGSPLSKARRGGARGSAVQIERTGPFPCTNLQQALQAWLPIPLRRALIHVHGAHLRTPALHAGFPLVAAFKS